MVARRSRRRQLLCHSGPVTYDPGRRGGGRAPAVRNDWREPLRAQRDPVAEDLGRPRANRDEHQQFRKQSWLGNFVSTYGWRAYALPILVVITLVVIYQAVTSTGTQRPLKPVSRAHRFRHHSTSMPRARPSSGPRRRG